jgi:single-stranded DNA-specific DHH superfamily exonuclease
MFEILNAHQDLISKFGRHHMAAGMTMDIDNVEALRAFKISNIETCSIDLAEPLA